MTVPNPTPTPAPAPATAPTPTPAPAPTPAPSPAPTPSPSPAPAATLTLPGDAATPEALAAFEAQLPARYRPADKPEAYTFEAKSEAGWDDALAQSFRTFAHGARLSTEAATAAAAWLTAEMAKGRTAHDATLTKLAADNAAALAKPEVFGAEAPVKTEHARRLLLQHTGVDALPAVLADLALIRPPSYVTVMRALAAAGAKAAEQPAPQGDPGSGGGGKLPLHERLYKTGGAAA